MKRNISLSLVFGLGVALLGCQTADVQSGPQPPPEAQAA